MTAFFYEPTQLNQNWTNGVGTGVNLIKEILHAFLGRVTLV